ncbi:MAG: cadherin-like domain-containing protein [Rhodoferax sp.]|nr:cadherin-like domain-containing protein [Rhodoferax sp.]
MTVVVRSNDTDPEGDTLTVTAVTNGANGSVTIDATSGNPVYTPNLNFVGTDTFTYTISDGNGGTDTATVSVTVGPNANDAPDAINDIASTTEDTPVTVVVRSNDTDPEGDTLTVTAVTNGANGSVTIDATSGNPVSPRTSISWAPTLSPTPSAMAMAAPTPPPSASPSAPTPTTHPMPSTTSPAPPRTPP